VSAGSPAVGGHALWFGHPAAGSDTMTDLGHPNVTALRSKLAGADPEVPS
jgi:hypothetical protein